VIRAAAEADLPVLKDLWLEFEQEISPPEYVDIDHAQEFREIEDIVRQHVAVVAEQDGGVVGFVLARMKGKRLGFIADLYVAPGARRSGVAASLTREAVARLRERGAEWIELDVQAENRPARIVYERWGFRKTGLELAAPAPELEARLSEGVAAESFGSLHVQTDDASAVERAVAQYVPRLGRSGGTIVSEPRNGWVAVYDELCDRDPQALRRLGRELSDRMGAVVLTLGIEEGAVVRYVLFDRGRVADEYASLPEYHGPLPPGDVVALRANPTAAARLTGADPARVREAAVTGSSPAGLPAPPELLAAVAAALGIEGAEHGFAGARE
jgi:ribosomal protein S18 acetylase RimI-like enzyme